MPAGKRASEDDRHDCRRSHCAATMLQAGHAMDVRKDYWFRTTEYLLTPLVAGDADAAGFAVADDSIAL